MTGERTRNRAVWRSGTAAILTLAALCGHGLAVGQSPQGFSPSQSSLLLSRTLVRPLADGNTITTRREYEVRITKTGDGFRVDGRLVNVGVEAPPSLRALAEIERRRPDDGPFPIQLDASGMILTGASPDTVHSTGQAATLVAERISGSALSAIDMLQAQAFVARLRRSAGRSQWPVDVFRPATGKRNEARSLVLPDGESGQVIVETVGQGPGPMGQVAALERIVTTDLGGDRRVTIERWQISRYSSDTER